MPFDAPYEYALLGAILFGGSMVQSIMGFGFGLFAIPLMLLMGIPPQNAFVVGAACAFTQIVFGLHQHRDKLDQIDRRHFFKLRLCAMATMPVGTFLLSILVTHWTPITIRQFSGGALLLLLIAQLTIHPQPRPHVPIKWGMLAMMTSGLLYGLVGMPAPPMVLWVMSHNWPSWRQRVTLWSMFAWLIPIHIGLLIWTFDASVADSALLGLYYVPVAWLGNLPGQWIARRLPTTILRRVTIAMIATICSVAILRPLL